MERWIGRKDTHSSRTRDDEFSWYSSTGLTELSVAAVLNSTLAESICVCFAILKEVKNERLARLVFHSHGTNIRRERLRVSLYRLSDSP